MARQLQRFLLLHLRDLHLLFLLQLSEKAFSLQVADRDTDHNGKVAEEDETDGSNHAVASQSFVF